MQTFNDKVKELSHKLDNIANNDQQQGEESA